MENTILDFLSTIGGLNFQFVWIIFIIAIGMFLIALIYWVWLDSGERTRNKWARVGYVLLVLVLNVFGWIIYLIIRPSDTISQIYWSDLERRYLKFETAELGDCPKCGSQLLPGFIYCPVCKYELKKKCAQCEVYVDKNYQYCPYCGQNMAPRVIEKIEEVPSIETMEKQNIAVKTEAIQMVESGNIKYSARRIPVKIGEVIIGSVKVIGLAFVKFANLFKRKKKIITEKPISQNFNKKKKNKKKKKR